MSSLAGAGDPALAPSTDLADVVALLGRPGVGGCRPGAAAGERSADGGGAGTPDGHRHRMLAFAAAHPDALVRSCLDGHFTGSAFVVDARAERCLLLFHTKLQRWLQPGGHADGDANLAGVALREATEETGIEGLRVDPDPVDLDVHEIPAGKDPAHLHLDVRYLVVAPPGAVAVGNHESQGLRWVAPGELDGFDLDPGLHRLAASAFARARTHLAG